MAKISLKPNNDYCPQTLFLYGTYDETVYEKLSRIAPIKTTVQTYLGYDGRDLGAWGEPMKKLGE